MAPSPSPVFLQTTPFSHHPELQPTEVASAHWIPLSHLYTPTPKWGTVSIDIATRLAPRSTAIRMALMSLLGRMDFRCILLPNDPWTIAEDSSDESPVSPPATGTKSKAQIQAGAKKTIREAAELQLWGLTLGMTM